MKSYEEWLVKEGMLETTINTYLFEVEHYFRWFEESYGCRPSVIIRENVLEYKSYLKNIRTYKGNVLHAKTINKKLSAIISYNNFVVDVGVQESIVIGKKDFQKFQEESYSPYRIEIDEVERIRQKILESGNHQLYVILTLMAFSGLRKFEIRNLRKKHIVLENNELIVYGKRDKFRKIFMNKRVRIALMEFLSRNHREEDEILFHSRESEMLSDSTINKSLKKYTNYCPHAFRHFFGYLLSENDFKEVEIAQFLGHSSVQTSRKYLAPNFVEVKNKVYKL